VLWPASGLALAILLLSPRRTWGPALGIFFTITLLSNGYRGTPFLASLGFALANTLEPLLAAWLLARLGGPPITFTRLKDVLALVVVIALVNAISASLGALVPALAFGASYWVAWLVWWVESSLGMLLLTPLVVLWKVPLVSVSSRLRPYRRLEMLAMLLSVSLAGWLVFGVIETNPYITLRPHMLFPLLCWAALRFPPRGGIAAVAVVALVALGSTVARLGDFPLGGNTPTQRLAAVQIYLLVASLTVLVLSTVFYERQQNEAGLRRSQALLAETESVAHVGSWRLDLRTGKNYWSDEMHRLFALPPGELQNDPLHAIQMRVHPEDVDRVRGILDLGLETRQPVSLDYRVCLPDGSQRLLHNEGRLILDAGGQALAFSGYVQDITQSRLAEQQLQQTLKEKETLLRELYHRTNNNMQVISSLLAMQAVEYLDGSPADEHVQALVSEAQARIQSMALVHRKLYQSQNLSSINFGAYLADLVSLVQQSQSSTAGRVRFVIATEDIPVSIDLAMPCGLVANELLTNALKHAFPGQRAGTVFVRLSQAAGSPAGCICLEIGDDGVGLPPGIDPRRSERLGMQGIFSLVETQLHGRVALLPSPGTHWRIEFTDNLYFPRV